MQIDFNLVERGLEDKMAIGNPHRMTPEELIEAQKADGSYVEPVAEVKEVKPKEKKQ